MIPITLPFAASEREIKESLKNRKKKMKTKKRTFLEPTTAPRPTWLIGRPLA